MDIKIILIPLLCRISFQQLNNFLLTVTSSAVVGSSAINNWFAV
jgi:hypothetical protein